VLASDAGNEAAIAWLTTQIATATLYTDQPDQGYYASVSDDLDIIGASASGSGVTIDWDDDHCHNALGLTCLKASAPLASDAAGNVIRYTIHRLCRMAGSPQGGGEQLPDGRRIDKFKQQAEQPELWRIQPFQQQRASLFSNHCQGERTKEYRCVHPDPGALLRLSR